MPNSTINFPELLNRVDNDRQLLHELFSIFKDEFPMNLRSLRDAVTHRDFSQTVKLSHAFKGTLANLAAAKAMNAAAFLEQIARAGDAAQLQSAFADFEQSVTAVLGALETYIAEARPA